MSVASEGSGDRTFIEQLFALHHGEIYAYIYRMVRDADVAADFAQDTFIKAYKAQGSLEDRAKARAWLYQIAHRIVLDEMRRRRIVRFLPWTGESHGAAPSAEHLAMEMRLSGPLARALARIPERQRAALLLAEVNDLTGLELADALGISHVAARALLTRARESLRVALADEKRQEKDREAAIDSSFAAARSCRRHAATNGRHHDRDAAMSPEMSPPRAEELPHERARILAAEVVDVELEPQDAEWLDGHLSACPDCRAIADEYREIHTELRSLARPEPPRDLWARTAAALDVIDAASGKRARGRTVGRQASRRPLIGTAVAVGLVLVATAVSVMSQSPIQSTPDPPPRLRVTLPLSPPPRVWPRRRHSRPWPWWTARATGCPEATVSTRSRVARPSARPAAEAAQWAARRARLLARSPATRPCWP